MPLATAVTGRSLQVDLEAEDSEISANGEEGQSDLPDQTRSDGLRMVVIGDSDFATNAQVQNMPNATLLANILNWLVDREALVSIPPKQPEQVRLNLSRSEMRRMTGLVLLGLPGLALGLGIYIFLRRRR